MELWCLTLEHCSIKVVGKLVDELKSMRYWNRYVRRKIFFLKLLIFEYESNKRTDTGKLIRCYAINTGYKLISIIRVCRYMRIARGRHFQFNSTFGRIGKNRGRKLKIIYEVPTTVRMHQCLVYRGCCHAARICRCIFQTRYIRGKIEKRAALTNNATKKRSAHASGRKFVFAFSKHIEMNTVVMRSYAIASLKVYRRVYISFSFFFFAL